MLRKLSLIVIAAVVAAALALPLFSQGPQGYVGHGPQGVRSHAGGGPGQGARLSHLDLSVKVILEGVVDGVNMAPGQGFPSFTMTLDGKKVTIVTSPYRLLLDANYTISVGNRMKVTAYPFIQTPDTYAAAELNNLTTSAILTLRDDSGVPVIMRGHRGDCPHLTGTTQP